MDRSDVGATDVEAVYGVAWRERLPAARDGLICLDQVHYQTEECSAWGSFKGEGVRPLKPV
jgi:hypothetical protein